MDGRTDKEEELSQIGTAKGIYVTYPYSLRDKLVLPRDLRMKYGEVSMSHKNAND